MMERRSSGEQVALYIRGLIFDGELRRGDRIPQDQIADALGVSRIPVREAIITLELEGWVTVEPHRGAFVNALDETAVRDHYELYGLILGFAARQATERADAEAMRRLDEITTELPAADTADDVFRLNEEFLAAIFETANSPRLRAVFRAMSGIVPGNFFEMVPGASETQKTGLGKMIAAMQAGEGEQAAEVCLDMMRHHSDAVVHVLQERGIFDAQVQDEASA